MPNTSLWQPFTIALDGSGNGSQEVGAPTLGYNWSGWVVMGAATAGQKVSVQVSGQVVAWGSSQTGPFAAGSGQMVTVTVTGGAPNSQLSGVLQGAVATGNLPQLPPGAGSGTLVDIASGTVTVDAANVTITGGQGGAVNVSTDAPPVQLGKVTVAPAGSTGSLNVSPSSSATGLLCFLIPTGNGSPTLTITGESGYIYFNKTFAVNTGGPVAVAVPANEDNPITVSVSGWTNQGSVTANAVIVSELDGSGIQNVVNNPLLPLTIQGIEAIAAGGGSDVLVRGEYAQSLGYAFIDMMVSGYQGASSRSVQTIREPPQLQASFGQSVSTSPTTIVLDAGASGQTIRLRRFIASTTETTAPYEIDLQDTDGNVYGKFHCVGTKDAEFDYEGLPLIASGVGVRVVIYATSGAWIGTLTYDKY